MYKNHSGSGTKHQEENTEGQIEADKNYQFWLLRLGLELGIWELKLVGPEQNCREFYTLGFFDDFL
jgi:hypothetical protein